MSNNVIMLTGNLTKDPELRFTTNGTPVMNCRIAATDRYSDASGSWKERTTYINFVAWRELAENAAHLSKGDRVTIVGRLDTRSYDDAEGVTRYVTEVVASQVSPSLQWAIAEPVRTHTPQDNRDRGDAPVEVADDESVAA